MTTTVQLPMTDNAFFKPVEVPLPLTHAGLLDASRKKFKAASKQSRLFDGVGGEEIKAGAVDVQLVTGAKVMVSGKAGWKGAARLRAVAAAAEALPAVDAAAERSSTEPGEPSSVSEDSATTREPSGLGASRAAAPPLHPEPLQLQRGLVTRVVRAELQLQLVSFSYDEGQPRDTAANVSARGLPNPGKSAKGRTGLDRRLAREVLASPGASELCECVVQEALRQIQRHFAAADAAAEAGGPPLLRVGVGCDRGLHRSVALAEAATTRLVRKAEHARSGRNSPGLEVLLRRVQLVDADHRELAQHSAAAGAVEEGEEGGVDRLELRLLVGA